MNDPVTREQLAAILYRYARYKGEDVSVGEDTNLIGFQDAGQVSEWAAPAVRWAVGVGLLKGDAAGCPAAPGPGGPLRVCRPADAVR